MTTNEQGTVRKIAIVGKAPSSIQLAPYDDKDWEIWSLADAHEVVSRVDLQFELHDPDEYRHNGKWKPGYFEWLCQTDIPVMAQRPIAEAPQWKAYPLDEMLERFSRRYFTNSISYMLALAIHLEPSDIGLYGVDMAQNDLITNSEYGHQKPSCEYFVGLAEGLGINVHIPLESMLCQTRSLYAFGRDGGFGLRMDTHEKELQSRLDHHRQQAEHQTQQVLAVQGAIEALRWCRQH
jgi:hypothetical protein